MKKLIFTLNSILIISLFAFTRYSSAQQIGLINKDGAKETQIELVSSNPNSTIIKFNVNGFAKKPVTTGKGAAYIIKTDKGTPILKAGAPDLNKLTASIIIPDKAKMNVEVISSVYTDYQNIDIAPSKGNLKRNINPATVPYTYSAIYQENRFFPAKLAELRKPYILRDFRGQTVIVYPFQYNPVTKTLRVYNEITVKVKVIPKANESANQFNRTKPLKKIQTDFRKIYDDHFLNYQAASLKYTPVEEQGNMLIICYGSFMSDMQPFIDWKKLKGIPVEIVDVATIGGATAIKSYVANYYNTNGLTFLLLVGDASEVPTYPSSSGDSDNSYAYISGSDSYPELFAGRFSAENTTHVQTMVTRTINYEKYPPQSGSWYNTGVGIASDEGPGDDGEMDYEHIRNIRSSLLGYNYSSVHELYDGSQGGQDAAGDATNTMLSNIVETGISIINYTGHGGQTSFVTTGMDNNDVNNLTNVDMYPFIFAVACVNGDFSTGTCFAEAWLRATHNSTGEPTGAIATVMSTINQSWDPPMSGHDEMNDILIESYGSNIKRTFGGLSMNGCMKMNDDYGAAGDEMTDTWTIFGDPSVVIRTDVPDSMTVTHDPTVLLGATQFQVLCNTEDALVSLTIDGEIIGTGYINGGVSTIVFTALSTVDTLKVTVTAYNKVPYLGDVLIIPPSGPYIHYSSCIINDISGNNDSDADYGESIELNVTLNNVGISTANDVSAVLSTTDTNIVISDNYQDFGDIVDGTGSTQDSAYSFTIADDIPDQHQVLFVLDISDSASNNWTSSFSITVDAPDLSCGNIIIDDTAGGNGNGILDDGETADIIILSSNDGHSDSPVAVGTLSTGSSYITINNNSCNLGTIGENGGTVNAIFNITVASSVPPGTSIDLIYDVTAGNYSAQRTYYKTINLVIEDFETNDFSQFDWTFGGNAPWFTTTENPYEGSYCSKSGAIGNDQSSEIIIELNVLADDSISFYKKVSSEQDWDFLEFYIDNTKMDEWSGVIGWSREVYPVAAGFHTFKWVYIKDTWYEDNDDCSWIDAVVLPPFNTWQPLATTISFNNATCNDDCDGSATLTASGGTTPYTYSWDDSNSQTTVTASGLCAGVYSVTVTDSTETTSVENVTISQPSAISISIISTDATEDTCDGNATVSVNGGTPSYTFLWDDPDSQTTTTATGLCPGAYIVTVWDNNGCYDSASVTVDEISTIDELQVAGYRLQVYPNPSKGMFTVEWDIEDIKDIRVFNIYNQELKRMVISKGNGSNKMEIDLSNYPAGIYNLQLIREKVVINKKFILE
ncbi:MAG: C25 family cysteine peptidase [Bacteroidota bacterium]